MKDKKCIVFTFEESLGHIVEGEITLFKNAILLLAHLQHDGHEIVIISKQLTSEAIKEVLSEKALEHDFAEFEEDDFLYYAADYDWHTINDALKEKLENNTFSVTDIMQLSHDHLIKNTKKTDETESDNPIDKKNFIFVGANDEELLAIRNNGFSTIRMHQNKEDSAPTSYFYHDLLTAIRCGDRKGLATRLHEAGNNCQGGYFFNGVTGFGTHIRWTGAKTKAKKLFALEYAVLTDKSDLDLVGILNKEYTEKDLKRGGSYIPFWTKKETITVNETAEEHRNPFKHTSKTTTKTAEYLHRPAKP